MTEQQGWKVSIHRQAEKKRREDLHDCRHRVQWQQPRKWFWWSAATRQPVMHSSPVHSSNRLTNSQHRKQNGTAGSLSLVSMHTTSADHAITSFCWMNVCHTTQCELCDCTLCHGQSVWNKAVHTCMPWSSRTYLHTYKSKPCTKLWHKPYAHKAHTQCWGLPKTEEWEVYPKSQKQLRSLQHKQLHLVSCLGRLLYWNCVQMQRNQTSIAGMS